MPRRVRSRDEQHEMHEAELRKLKRTYRIMQGDYRRYRDVSNMALIKLNNLLSPMEKEQTELNILLNSMVSETNKRKDKQTVQKLIELTDDHVSMGAQIEKQEEEITRLTQEIWLAKERLVVQRKRMGGSHVMEEERAYLEKKRAIFENRLNQGIMKFNKQLTINKELREEIDELRSQRGVYSGLYKEMEQELSETKSNLHKVIDQSTQAFEQRDEAQTKMEALRTRKEKDDHMYESEMRALLRTIHHEEKMQLFMTTKGNERAEYKAERAARTKRQRRKPARIELSQLDSLLLTIVEKKGPAADKLLLKSYQDAMQTIEDVTQQRDVSVIATNFTSLEEDNFAQYMYANELHNECQQLRNELETLRSEISEFEQGEHQTDQQKYRSMMALENDYQVVDQDVYVTEKRLKHITQTLKDVCTSIGDLFARAGCDASPLYPLLDGDDPIQPKNVCRYLSLVESCVMKALEAYYLIKLRKKLQPDRVPSRTEHINLNMQKKKRSLSIAPISMDDEALSEEDECYPLKEQELRDRVLTYLDKNPNIGLAFQDSIMRITMSHK